MIKESLRIEITAGERWSSDQRIVEITGIVPGVDPLVRYRRVVNGELKGDETKAHIGYFLSNHRPEVAS